MNLFKLAIPAFIFTLISENVCFSNDEVHDNIFPFGFSMPTIEDVQQKYFLPHTFWKQTPKEITSYLKTQILETKPWEYFLMIKNHPRSEIRKTQWSQEEHFKELIYDKISEFMIDKEELMPSLDEFKASFDKHLAFYSDCITSGKICSEDYGDSNLMAWLAAYSPTFTPHSELMKIITHSIPKDDIL